MIAAATGASKDTVGRGAGELETGGGRWAGPRDGLGRKPVEHHDPGLWPALDELVDPESRGDPDVAAAVDDEVDWQAGGGAGRAGSSGRGRHGGAATQDLDYSLQANAKTIEGAQHPDRDGQFRYINDQVTTPWRPGSR